MSNPFLRSNQISPEEQSKLVAGFEDFPTIQASGIYLAGTKYLTIHAEDRSIYGKKGVGERQTLSLSLTDHVIIF